MYVICTDNLVTNEFGTFACDEKVSIIDTKSCGAYIFTFYRLEEQYGIICFSKLNTPNIESFVFDVTRYIETADMYMLVIDNKIILCHDCDSKKYNYITFEYAVDEDSIRMRPSGIAVLLYDTAGEGTSYLIGEPLARRTYKTDEYLGDICTIMFPKVIKYSSGRSSCKINCSLTLVKTDGVYQSRNHYIDPADNELKSFNDNGGEILKITSEYKFIIKDQIYYKDKTGDYTIEYPHKINGESVVCCLVVPEKIDS